MTVYKQRLIAASVIADMRSWVAECVWRDIIDPEDIEDLTDYEIVRGIDLNYEGGVRAFIDTCNLL